MYYTGGVAAPSYGPGEGPILFTSVRCTGIEYALFMCANTSIIPSECTHERDAAVQCTPGSGEQYTQRMVVSKEDVR